MPTISYHFALFKLGDMFVERPTSSALRNPLVGMFICVLFFYCCYKKLQLHSIGSGALQD